MAEDAPVPLKERGVRLGDRSLFPSLKAQIYLNHAAISPPSLLVQESVQHAVQRAAEIGLDAWMDFRGQRERLRQKIAQLTQADPNHLALTPNTTAGVIDIALSYPWRPGDRVILFEGEFPTNVTPWLSAAKDHELEIVFLQAEDFRGSAEAGFAGLEKELRKGVGLVATSAVQFQSGLRMPIKEMGSLAHRFGAEIFVDAIQALGIVPLDLCDSGVDYLACGSHKWLMGLEGAGFLFIHPQRIDSLKRSLTGWLSHEDAAEFLFAGPGHLRYDRPIRSEASFLESGAPNSVGFVALEAALDALLELTVPEIFQHVNQVLDPLEEGLKARGFHSLRAAEPSQRSGILSVVPPDKIPLIPLWTALNERGIACTIPDGVLRFAPHWPNSIDDAEGVLAILDEVCQSI